MHKLAARALTLLCLIHCCPVRAQQSRDLPPEIVTLFADRDAFRTLNKEATKQAKDDPAGALAACRKFLADRPKLSAETAYQVGAVMMALYYERLHDLASAMAIPDAFTAKYGETPARALLFIQKANIVLAEKRAPEAEDIVRDLWRKGPWEDNLWINRQGLEAYLNVLQAEGKTEDMETTLRGVLLQNPQLMGNGGPRQNSQLDQSLPKRLTEILVGKKQYDEAISWAKLGYMTANFDEKSMADALNTLTKIWEAAGTPDRAVAFARAQTDPKAPNPLQAVPLPPIDLATQGFREQALAGDKLKSRDRISMYIAEGKFKKAMIEARRRFAAEPAASGRADEVARVFKAADLNPLRAAAFFEAQKNGNGADMVNDFLAGNNTAAPAEK